MCDFVRDYLVPREAGVAVQGADPEPFEIADQVFQGTVLGPPSLEFLLHDCLEANTKPEFQSGKVRGQPRCSQRLS